MLFDEGLFEQQQRDLHEALSLARQEGIAIMGAGGFARALHNACQKLGVHVHAFVVSRRSTSRSMIDGVDVLQIDEVAANILACPLWIAIFNREDDAELTQLRRQGRRVGFRDVRVPQEFYPWVASDMGWRFWLSPLHGYREQWPLIEQAKNLLADEESRLLYESIIGFRRGLLLETPHPVCAEQQYFPNSLQPYMPHACHYLDGGAYDGDTLGMADEALGVEQAYVFEPDPENYRRLCEYTAGQPWPVIQFPLGLSDHSAFLRFRSGQGEGSSLDCEGDSQIQVVALDDLLRNKRIDFFKLDIEGSETSAMQGAWRLLQANRPFLAIAGYHCWDDLWRIPLLIRDLSEDYRIVLRTHRFNSFESIFYAYR